MLHKGLDSYVRSNTRQQTKALNISNVLNLMASYENESDTKECLTGLSEILNEREEHRKEWNARVEVLSIKPLILRIFNM
jgi:hypothetical protein